MLLNLAKGQEYLKVLFTKESKNKNVVILNMGKKFKGLVHQIQVEEDSSKEDENQDEDARSTRDGGGNNQISEDEDFSDEKYPPTDDKYKQLDDKLKSMEIQVVPGLDFEELGLVPGIVIPYKFKILVFSKYDGVSSPKLHLRSYVRKIQPHTADRKLWVHFSKRAYLEHSWSGFTNWRG